MSTLGRLIVAIVLLALLYVLARGLVAIEPVLR